MNLKTCIRIVGILCFSVMVTACATRPDEDTSIRTIVPVDAIDTSRPVSVPKRWSQDTNHSIIAFSAGGADGAFGAGVIAGWTQKGTRPEFDVVTGVSTGGLLAVLTFLGPEYDALSKELYTNQTNDKIFKNRGLNGIFSDSLYDNTPLKSQIEKYVDAGMLAKIAREHQKGRRLYIATTNLDAGQLVIWDMGKIAMGGRANPVQHFQKVLRASAAVPGFFPPVYIKPQKGVQLRQAHVDGGVKEPILYSTFMGRSSAKEKNLYIIVNGTTKRFNDTNPVQPNLASIAQKTIFELMRELQSDTIFRHYARVQNSGFKFHLTAIPDDVPVSDKSLDFDPERMQNLYNAGFALGLSGPDSWETKPPSLLREASAN